MEVFCFIVYFILFYFLKGLWRNGVKECEFHTWFCIGGVQDG